MSNPVRQLAFFTLAIVVVAPLQAQEIVTHSPQRASAVRVSAVRNPPFLRATEIPGRGSLGAQPRIRFEWEQVPGCSAYVLAGQWTDNQWWAIRSFEYRVTDRNAKSWIVNRVTFDISVAQGSHSWKLVAVFGPDDAGDFENPAHVSFNIQ